MSALLDLGDKLHALSHPVRTNIVLLLVKEKKDMYLNEIANNLEINRALAKIHLKKLEHAGIVKSWVVLVKGEARALRYYRLLDFDIHITPELLEREVNDVGK
jgi:predicted ArsR family transcriptional regulator